MQGALAGLPEQMHRKDALGPRGVAGWTEASRVGAPPPRPWPPQDLLPGRGAGWRTAQRQVASADRRLHAGYFVSLLYSGGYTTAPRTSPDGEDGTGPSADGLDGVAGLIGVTPASCGVAVLPPGTDAVPAAAGTGLVASCMPPRGPAAASAGTGWEEACAEGVFEASPSGATLEGWRAGEGKDALPGWLWTARGWRAERGADKASASFLSGEAGPSDASWRTTGMVSAAPGVSDGAPDACAFS